MKQVTANVFVETEGRGCNPGFVVTEEGLVLVDTPQRPSDAVAWRKDLSRRGPLRYLINTEHHGDHWTGNYFFELPIIAYKGTREAIARASLPQMKETVRQIDPKGLKYMVNYEIRPPTITFTGELTLYLGRHTFYLLHLPGHTANEVAVYVPQERVVFTGDNVSYKAQLYMSECLPFEWLRSLKRIGELDVDHIIPGHGEVCNKSYLKEEAAFIEEWIAAVREALAKGQTKEEAQANISFLRRYPMPPSALTLGPELQRMNVARLYDVLKEQARATP